ncbi:MAG: hypothetical protein HS124_01870 [Anaerolineales bacterium]|nr:hypothetical protein [Anaerolineales bacterium]MCL4260914.1 hypothetical protein [Anaerolineales bacterium]
MKKTLIVLLTLILTACSADELSRNRQIWEDADISHYRFQLRISCFCSFMEQMPLTVEVRDGEVVAMTANDGTLVAADDLSYKFFDRLGTIDRLFAELERALKERGRGDINITYDASLGYPVKASIDYIKQAVDDELYIEISGFEALP